MRPSPKTMVPILLILFAFIPVVPAGYGGDIPAKTPLLFSAADAGPEPILLAAARPIPNTDTNAKKATRKKTSAQDSVCPGGMLPLGSGGDIEIKGETCTVGAGTYHYGFVYIHSSGTLEFADAQIDFWARSILIENEGSLVVGSATNPIGNTRDHNVVTFHLYGDESQTAGITCKTEHCGVLDAVWTDKPNNTTKLPSGVRDYFYQYQRLPADGNLDGTSYFGLKTLAVSYGGTLQMFGWKGGSNYQDPNPHDDPSGGSSGMSWVRLNQNICPPNSIHTACKSPDEHGTQVVLDRSVQGNWQKGDWIVVTTTDFLPGHSEMRQILSIDNSDNSKSVITVDRPFSYPHNGEMYDLGKHKIPERLSDDGKPFMTSVDTRAAVALLTRSIQIVSEGADYGQPFPAPSTPGSGKYFGGHVIARQGFKQFQMKGVELKQLGQGGRMAHSPVNFHMARQLPAEGSQYLSYVMDCSVNESMTRMYEIRGTQGLILKRNVGYMSIGHGYFLAEGTETNNVLKANIGIYARPAVDYRDNPRKVPGILASPDGWHANFGKYATDIVHPSVFYIANGYNTFEDNMAVGAGTCGACYWMAPVQIGGLSKIQSWQSYAGIQRNKNGTAPLKRFQGNFCSTAQYSIMTIDSPGVDACHGVEANADPRFLHPIMTPFDAGYKVDVDSKQELYPNIGTSNNLVPTRCTASDCTQVGTPHDPFPCRKGFTENCAVNVIDSYTSSFHWAQQNFSAIWLRTNWFLFTNGALTDVLNGGLTMVSGGDWSAPPNQYWALTRKSVFIGSTQEDKENVFAQNRGPVNADTTKQPSGAYTRCYDTAAHDITTHCLVLDENGTSEGIVIPTDNFSVYQRLYNIYDGPVYQEANAFLNIKEREVKGCDDHDQDYPAGKCKQVDNFIYFNTRGIPRATEGQLKGKCFMPNAAIGWKQPNGFYYPPAFHSKNLFFDDVDLRHYVIVPLFKPGTLDGNATEVMRRYCSYPPYNVIEPEAPKKLFVDWTDIDRQTELNDDDGSLSGLSGSAPPQIIDTNGTVSVNRDQFYYAPKSPFECLSEQSCYQSPYDYVSAVVLPSFAGTPPAWPPNWYLNSDSPKCFGVPIYRQYLNAGETAGEAQGIQMMGAAIRQRSTMIANKGLYYIDTAVSKEKQLRPTTPHVIPGKDPPELYPALSVFEAGHKYNFFLIYAKNNTKVAFQLYVGNGFQFSDHLKMVRVGYPDQDGKVLSNWAADIFATPVEKSGMSYWPDGWTRHYHNDTGILEVTMDLTLAEFLDDFKNAKHDSCGPPSFCEWKPNGKCGCVEDPMGIGCQDSICEWSSHRSECPQGGCYGFQVEFPNGFVADDNTSPTADSHYMPLHRPAPLLSFPDELKNISWEKAPYPLAFDASVPWDHDVYPVPGPCDYNNQDPGNAPLPHAGSAAAGRKRK